MKSDNSVSYKELFKTLGLDGIILISTLHYDLYVFLCISRAQLAKNVLEKSM
jgi:hypothetical protein